MTLRPTLREDVDRAARLYDEEVALRARARANEAQRGTDAADRLFEAASALREERLALLRRCALI